MTSFYIVGSRKSLSLGVNEVPRFHAFAGIWRLRLVAHVVWVLCPAMFASASLTLHTLSLNMFPLPSDSFFFARHIYLPLPRCRYCCGSVAVAVVAFVSSTNKISAINIRLPMRQRVNMSTYVCVCVCVCAQSYVLCLLPSSLLPSLRLSSGCECEHLFTYSQVFATSQLFPVSYGIYFHCQHDNIRWTSTSSSVQFAHWAMLSLGCNLFRQVTLGCLF